LTQRFKTQYLRDIVHPVPLKEALRTLKLQGEVEWYKIWRYTTIIRLTKHSGLSMMIKEASQPVAATHSHVKNKTNDRPQRKIKG
jgi:hypothetical protein